MIKVLFVCLGNICRSPMAEAVFRKLLQEEKLDHLFQIDSAGLGGWHEGEPPHHGTREILKKYQISADGIKARKIAKGDLHSFDYIIAMDDDNMKGIEKLLAEKTAAFVGKLMDFVENPRESNVPDPYYTGNFDYVYELISEGCEKLLEKIKQEQQLQVNNGVH